MINVIRLIILIALTINSFGATTGVLYLKGTIPELLSISVTPTPNATTLDLANGANDLKVADVTEEANVTTGYVIKMRSDNASNLVHSSGDYIPYTVSYGAASNIILTNADSTVKTVSTGGIYTSSVDLTITFNGINTSTYRSGDYTDNIYITIEVN